MVEIEEFCGGFRQQAPEVNLTTLRFANIIGPTAPSPMNEMLSGRTMPLLLGFDPLMQLVHEDDVIAAIVHAIEVGEAANGVFNVAADGLLPLTRLAALTSTIPAPLLHPLAYWGYDALRNTPLNPARYLPLDADYLRYRWVADRQKMSEELGFHPHYTAEEAVREFAGHKRTAQYSDGEASLAFDEERLQDTLERRRRQRERMAQTEEK
jgi:UDP-glucose 4-epimerase